MRSRELSERPVQVLDKYRKECPNCQRATVTELIFVSPPRTGVKSMLKNPLLAGVGDGYVGYFEHCRGCGNTFAIKPIGGAKAREYGWDIWQGYKGIPKELRVIHLLLPDRKEVMV